MRKTIAIIELIDEVNRRNAESTCDPAARAAWNSLLEGFLHKHNVYDGFGYLRKSEVPRGHKPGIIYGDTPKNNQFPDETRRYYYRHPKLTRKAPKPKVKTCE